MKIITRIYEYIDFQEITVCNFERKMGISNGYLAKMKARNADIGEGILRKILENCPEISVEWLVTGRGEMLRAVGAVRGQESPPEPPHAAALPTDQSALVAALQQTIAAKDELIAELKKRCAILEEKPPNSTTTHPQAE